MVSILRCGGRWIGVGTSFRRSLKVSRVSFSLSHRHATISIDGIVENGVDVYHGHGLKFVCGVYQRGASSNRVTRGTEIAPVEGERSGISAKEDDFG